MRGREIRTSSHSLLLCALVVCALLTAAAIVRWNDWTYGSDTGTFAQAVLNTFHGFSDALENGSHFRFHFSPILGILWPLIAIFRTPLVLQFVQILLIGICPLIVARLMHAYVREPWPTRCGLLVLLYPPLLAGAFSEFHELAFYPPVILGLLLAADRARWRWFALLSLAAVCIREDASVDLIVIGVALAAIGIVRRTTRERGLFLGEPVEPERLSVAGLSLALLAAISLELYTAVILPKIGSWAPSHFYDYPFASGPLQTALAIFTHPIALIAAIATLGRLTYVLEAIAPLALLPLFSRWSLLAVPGIAGIILASDASVWRMGMHYELLWAPLLVLAAAWKLAQLVRSGSADAARVWWITAIVCSIVVLAAFNPMHPAHYLKRAAYTHTNDLAVVLRCVPRDAPIAMHDEWFAREALNYPHATVLGANPQSFDGYVVYASDWNNPLFERVLPALKNAEQSGAYSLACASGSVRAVRATAYRTTE